MPSFFPCISAFQLNSEPPFHNLIKKGSLMCEERSTPVLENNASLSVLAWEGGTERKKKNTEFEGSLCFLWDFADLRKEKLLMCCGGTEHPILRAVYQFSSGWEMCLNRVSFSSFEHFKLCCGEWCMFKVGSLAAGSGTEKPDDGHENLRFVMPHIRMLWITTFNVQALLKLEVHLHSDSV